MEYIELDSGQRRGTAANPTVLNINKDFHQQIQFYSSHAVAKLSLSVHFSLNSPAQRGLAGQVCRERNQITQDLQEPGLQKGRGRSAWVGMTQAVWILPTALRHMVN